MGGRREGAGRPKGAANKISRDIREMILQALDQVGGVNYLAQRAIDTPGPFLALLSKVMPMQVASADGSPVHLHLLAARQISDAECYGADRQPANGPRVGPGHWRRTGYEGGAAGVLICVARLLCTSS